MARIISESIFLCSIYPGQLRSLARPFGPDGSKNGPRNTVYKFKPVNRHHKDTTKRYDVIEVSDAYENVPDLNGQSAGGKMSFSPLLVSCQEIVKDLISEWRGSLVNTNGYGPGVMQIIGTVPTQAELRKLMDMQTGYFEVLVQEGDQLALAKPKNWTKMITEPMRLANDWLGRNRLWANPDMTSTDTPCPYCKQVIKDDQIICHHCHKQVKAEPEGFQESLGIIPSKKQQPQPVA